MNKHYFYGVYCMNDGFGPCNNGEPIGLTEQEYKHQLARPDSTWRCPRCYAEAQWDDESGVCNG